MGLNKFTPGVKMAPHFTVSEIKVDDRQIKTAHVVMTQERFDFLHDDFHGYMFTYDDAARINTLEQNVIWHMLYSAVVSSGVQDLYVYHTEDCVEALIELIDACHTACVRLTVMHANPDGRYYEQPVSFCAGRFDEDEIINIM